MAIYRGAGGAGDATNDATSQAILAAQSAQEAAASEAAAASSASSAATSASNAASSATSAASSATSASNSASSATTQAADAASSAATATTKASEAADSATAAASSATSAAASATNASNSATAAANSATSASNSASAASASATNAATYASNAATSATNASNSASAASTSATNAATSETLASQWATKTSGTVDGSEYSAKYYANQASSLLGSKVSKSGDTMTGTLIVPIIQAVGTNGTVDTVSTGDKLRFSYNGWNYIEATGGLQSTIAMRVNSINVASYDQGGITFNKSLGLTGDIDISGSYKVNGTAIIPTQTGNSGKYLTTNGTVTSWATVDALPDQTGNAGEFLTTNGSTASWAPLNTAATGFGFKNRIINGAMMIDQRNAGASVAISDQTYTLDRWVADRTGGAATATVARSTVSPDGFTNSLLYTVGTGASSSTTNYSNVRQYIEGFNVADFAFGTSAAATVALSFWVRSSLTGTFGVALSNSAYNRNYIASYSINAANTWERKTITISGDTSGTWLTNNGTGLRVIWDLGVGSTYSASASGSWTSSVVFGLTGGVKLAETSGATFYITGVQLEKGSTATSFDYRPYGTELALCQRYALPVFGSFTGFSNGTTVVDCSMTFPVPMRTAPTASSSGATVASCVTAGGATSTQSSLSFTFQSVGVVSQFGASVRFSNFSGLTSGQAAYVYTNASTPAGFLTAEL